MAASQPHPAREGAADNPPWPTTLAGFVDSLEARAAALAGPLDLAAEDLAGSVPGSDEPPD